MESVIPIPAPSAVKRANNSATAKLQSSGPGRLTILIRVYSLAATAAAEAMLKLMAMASTVGCCVSASMAGSEWTSVLAMTVEFGCFLRSRRRRLGENTDSGYRTGGGAAWSSRTCTLPQDHQTFNPPRPSCIILISEGLGSPGKHRDRMVSRPVRQWRVGGTGDGLPASGGLNCPPQTGEGRMAGGHILQHPARASALRAGGASPGRCARDIASMPKATPRPWGSSSQLKLAPRLSSIQTPRPWRCRWWPFPDRGSPIAGPGSRVGVRPARGPRGALRTGFRVPRQLAKRRPCAGDCTTGWRVLQATDLGPGPLCLLAVLRCPPRL
jgi:hypothetical protein